MGAGMGRLHATDACQGLPWDMGQSQAPQLHAGCNASVRNLLASYVCSPYLGTATL